MTDSTEDENEGRGAPGDAEGDRRESVRVRISSEVTMKTVTHLTTGAGTDLSVGGIYVVTTQELPVGSLVDIEFTVDTVQRHFRVLGEVRWRQSQPVGREDRSGLGIEFLNLRPEDEEALREFVERRSPVEPAETRSKTDAGDEKGGVEGERRDDLRVPISSHVRLKTVANFTSAAGSDLSVGGIYVVSAEDFSTGSVVELEFTVDDIDREFRVPGRVRWRQRQPIGDEQRWGLGIEFEDIDPVDRRALEDFVEQREPVEPSEQFADVETNS